MLVFLCPVQGRVLKNLILALLKSQSASQVIRQNYTQSYVLQENKVQKQQAKLLLVIPHKGMEAKIKALVWQQVPTSQLLNEFPFGI